MREILKLFTAWDFLCRGICTVRDLKKEHLPLLKSIRDESMKAIEERFGIKRN